MDYVGARWYKCDFHLHTMSSYCYKEKSDTPDDWVSAVKSKGLQCIAVTDHNDYRGIDEIKRLCANEGITVFPGVELSCDSSKIHILILFDVTKSQDDVRDFLSVCEIFGDSIGKSEVTAEGIFTICDKAHERNALVIAAHIDEFNGLKDMSYDNLEKILSGKYVDAVQIVNGKIWDEYKNHRNCEKMLDNLCEKYNKRISEDEAKKWMKVYKKALDCKMPMIMSSDNPASKFESHHGLWGIGRTYSWIKMGETPNLEGLRQALLANDIRVKNCLESNDIPSKLPEIWIESIKASNTELNINHPIEVRFNPQLNSIIGGRGSGKSSIIRMITGGLLAFDSNTIDVIKKEQEDFYKRKGKSSREDSGVFNNHTCIEIQVFRNGDLYKVEINDINSMQKQTRVLKRYDYEKRVWDVIDDIYGLERLKIKTYTQKQIYEIGKQPNSLLKIIDEDIEELQVAFIEKDTALSNLLSKMADIRNTKAIIDSESRVRSEIKDYEEQIKKYESSGISKLLHDKQQYISEEKVVKDYIDEKNKYIEKISLALEQLLLPHIEKDNLSNSTELLKLLDDDVTHMDEEKGNIEKCIENMKQSTDILLREIEKTNWKCKFVQCEKDYEVACDKLEAQGVEIGKLDDLLANKNKRLSEIDKIEHAKDKLQILLQEKKDLYSIYYNAVQNISKLREQFIKSVMGSGDNVKFEIQRNRDRNSFEQFMRNALQKDNNTINDDILELCDVFFGKNGVDKFRELILKIREEEDKSSCSKYFRKAVLDMPAEMFDKMMVYIPDDELRVSYRPESSKKFIPLSNASAGQKTTAVLTFILAYGDTPLLLDQPEDDLDNKLVYDLVVKRLKIAKGKRQLIVVTHNANIPVNGDAEYITSMDSESKEVNIKYVGTIDDDSIRKEICDVMEGTQHAFEMRAKKYHILIDK